MSDLARLSSARSVGVARHLRSLNLYENALSGSIPECLGENANLENIAVANNRLGDVIPASLGSLQSLYRFGVRDNRLTGPVSDIMRWMPAMLLMDLCENLLSGTLVAGTSSASSLIFSENLLSSSIPDGHSWLTSTRDLRISRNQLTGTIPAVWSMLSVDMLALHANQLAGTVPAALAKMKAVSLHWNALVGPMELAVAALRRSDVWLQDNRLTGSLPPAWLGNVDHFNRMSFLAGGNLLEGSIPPPWGGGFIESRVDTIDVSARSMSSIHGGIPQSMSRTRKLTIVSLHGNMLEGHVPRFHCTMVAMTLHENFLQSLADVQVEVPEWQERTFGVKAAILVHRNRLSCHVTEHGNPKLTLGAVGNNFFHPRTFPEWISPDERSKLLWANEAEGKWLFARISAGALLLLMLLHHSRVHISEGSARLQQLGGDLGEFGQALHGTVLRLQIGFVMSIAMMLKALGPRSHACLNTFLLLSACHRRLSGGAQCLVAARWYNFSSFMCWQWWISFSRRDTSSAITTSSALPQSLSSTICMSVCWTMLVSFFSMPVVVQVGAECVPHFMRLHGIALTIMTTLAGSCQAVSTSLLLPSLARALNPAAADQLVSLGSVMASICIPVSVIIFFEGSCLSNWAQSLDLCRTESGQGRPAVLPFKVEVNGQMLTIVKRADVCSVSRHCSVTSCMQAVTAKMQVFLLGKFFFQAFVLPSMRLAVARHRRMKETSRKMVLDMGMLLVFSSIFGGFLPLLQLLLLVGGLVGCSVCFVAVSRKSFDVTADKGIANLGITLGLMTSISLHLILLDELAVRTFLLVIVVQLSWQAAAQ